MKFFIALLLISCSALAEARVISGRSPQLRQHSLTAFLKKTLLNLRNNDATLLTGISVEDLSLTSNEPSLTYFLYMSSAEFQNIPIYSVSNVATDSEEGSIEFELLVENLAMTGNYSLDGTVSSVIALKGEGLVNISSHSVAIVGRGEIESDNVTTSIKNLRLMSIGSTVDAKFEGIQGEELIGEIIKDDLIQIGNDLFDKALEDLNSVLIPIITDYINVAIEEMPLETILRTKVVDTLEDGPVTGWNVNDYNCVYSEHKINFTCDGNPVVIDESGSSGFWMSCLPQVGEMCTLFYGNDANEKLHQMQFEGWFSEESAAMVEIWYEGAGQTDVEIFDETGIIEFDTNKNVTSITLYPNDPPSSGKGPLYTILDRVLLVTSS